MEPLVEMRQFWDADAATYDRSPTHHLGTGLARAVWGAVLARLLPPPPARVLDVGAGTGFLSLTAARLGHRVSAVDLSPEMLERLRTKAAAEGLDIETIEGSADEPPDGEFAAIVERHLVWTLPDPAATLRRWRDAAPSGRLVLFESAWGAAADQMESLKARGRELLRRARQEPPHHHGHYPPDLRDALPFGTGMPVERLLELVADSGWGPPRLERLHDAEWSLRVQRPGPDRVLGVMPCFAVSAGALT